LSRTAVNAGNFQYVGERLLRAKSWLKSSRVHTVFAPTDEGCQAARGNFRFSAQDIPKLKRIVTYHVAFGDVRAEDLMQIEEAETVEGSIVAIESSNDGIKVNDAKVMKWTFSLMALSTLLMRC